MLDADGKMVVQPVFQRMRQNLMHSLGIMKPHAGTAFEPQAATTPVRIRSPSSFPIHRKRRAEEPSSRFIPISCMGALGRSPIWLREPTPAAEQRCTARRQRPSHAGPRTQPQGLRRPGAAELEPRAVEEYISEAMLVRYAYIFLLGLFAQSLTTCSSIPHTIS